MLKKFSSYNVWAAIIIVFFIALKLPRLADPFFWDELGTYVPQVNMILNTQFKILLPWEHAGIFDYHPPLFPLTGAAFAYFFKLTPTSLHLLTLFFSVIALIFTYMIGVSLKTKKTGIIALLFVAFSPIFYVQSTMFLPDLPVASLGIALIYFSIKNKIIPYIIIGAYMSLFRESSLGFLIPCTIYLISLNKKLLTKLIILIPITTLPSYVLIDSFLNNSWNVTREISNFNIFDTDFIRRNTLFILKWSFIEQGRIILSAIVILGALKSKTLFQSKKTILLFCVIFIFVATFLFDYTWVRRYMLPAFPLIALLAAFSLDHFTKKIHYQALFAGLYLCAVSLNYFSPPPCQQYSDDLNATDGFEYDFRYRDVIENHSNAVAYINNNLKNKTFLAAFPFDLLLEGISQTNINLHKQAQQDNSLPVISEWLSSFDYLVTGDNINPLHKVYLSKIIDVGKLVPIQSFHNNCAVTTIYKNMRIKK